MRGARCAVLTERQLGGLARTQLWGRHGGVGYITIWGGRERKEGERRKQKQRVSQFRTPTLHFIPEKLGSPALFFQPVPEGCLLDQSEGPPRP